MIVGVDPGRDKIGFAAVSRDGELLFAGILPSGESCAFQSAFAAGEISHLRQWLTVPPKDPDMHWDAPFVFAVGDGTLGTAAADELAARFGAGCVHSVDERGTTLEAKPLYWSIHKPSLLQMLLPRALRIPPRSLDDMAAWAIAKRFIGNTSAE